MDSILISSVIVGLIAFCIGYFFAFKKQKLKQNPIEKELHDVKGAIDKTAIVAITDSKGKILEVNDKFCEISKYAREELIGQDHRILNSGYHEKDFFKNMWSTIGKGKPWQAEVKNKAKDGSFYWVDTKIVPFLNEKGKPEKYVAIRFDITSRKETEQLLRESAIENENLSKNLQDITRALDETAIVAITNEKGIIEKVNDKFCEISKYSREELIGQDHRILNSGYHDKDFFKNMWATIGRGQIWQAEVKNKARDGNFYWVDTHIVPLLSRKGKPQKYVAIRFYITSRKYTEEQLRVSGKENEELERNLAAIYNAIDETAIVAITDTKGVIRRVNDKFCELSKYAPSELLGQDHRILNSGHHPKEFFKNMWATIGRGYIWRGEVKNRAKDGSFYWVDTHVVPLLNPQGKPERYIAIRFDITKKVEIEESLRLALGDNKKYAKVFSHDVKTPLRGISTLADFIKDDLGDNLSEELDDHLNKIKSKAHIISSLADNLLHFSNVNEDEENKLFNTGEVIIGLVKKFDTPINVDGDWPTIKSKRLKFKQIFGHLIDNAVSFSPDEQKKISLSVQEKEFDYVFKVKDNGPGIKEEYHEKIFELFQVLNDWKEDTSKGIGLTVTKKLVNQLGGEIWVESDGKSGAAFFIKIPKRF